jgi:hypothetical protein
MPITINYNDFLTPTGQFPTTPNQPYQYSGIYDNITNLATDDRVIVFSGIPNGLRIASNPSTTQPFDSVFMDIESYDDYVLLSGISVFENVWQGDSLYGSAGLSCGYTQGGFWAFVNTDLNEAILTGSGNASSSILDIAFQAINFSETTYGDFPPPEIELSKATKTLFNGGSGAFPNVIFNQLENYSWYGTHVSQIGNFQNLRITGTSFAGSGSSIILNASFSGMVNWVNDQLTYTAGDFECPYPFDNCVFKEGYSWNSTVANEILSNYTVLANNSGNSGIGIIQIASSASNGQQFTDLIPPLRKVHVAFTRA